MSTIWRVALVAAFLTCAALLVAAWRLNGPVVLTHGPVVGAVTSDSAKVFVRTSRAATVQIRFGTDRSLAQAQQSTRLTTKEEGDYTQQITLWPLKPSTTYYLDVLVGGRPQLARQRPSFTTFPAQNAAQDFTVVVLTDFAIPFRKVPYVATFKHAYEENPAFVIIGGDFDHSDPSGATPAQARVAKRQMFKYLYRPADMLDDIVSAAQHRWPAPSGALREFTDLILRRFAVVHTWDDHDYGKNDGDKTYIWKTISLDVMKEYFPLYDTAPNGIWQRFRFAQAEFFLLDLRSQRDPNLQPDGPDKSILDGDDIGPTGQKAWLKDGLLHSTARWKFIVSSSVFNPTLRKQDSWSDYQYEQEELLAFIAANHIEDVIILSGDAHFGALDSGQNAKLPEMISPGANLEWGTCGTVSLPGQTPGIWSEGIYRTEQGDCNGYGVVRVLTNPDRVELMVKDDQGKTRLSYTVQ